MQQTYLVHSMLNVAFCEIGLHSYSENMHGQKSILSIPLDLGLFLKRSGKVAFHQTYLKLRLSFSVVLTLAHEEYSVAFIGFCQNQLIFFSERES